MIDVHCHLNFHSYEKEYDDVIQKAFAAGVEKIINVGTKIYSSQKAVDLAQQYENLYAIVGVHPHHADKHDIASNWLEELEILAKQPKVVAIGEIGLDYFRYQSNGVVNIDLQKEIFEAQIMLAYKLKLPLQIHNRHAGKDTLEILRHHKNYLQSIPGMFHCFAGDMEILKGVLDLGFYVGFDGNSTYKGLAPGETETVSDLAKATPLDKIVTETDSPFLTPEPHRGTRNTPAYVIIVGEFLAKTKGILFEEMQKQTVANAKRLFNL